jgi:hypothetical protein
MFLVFVASALVVTGVVWALAAAGAWWLLPAAFAIHIAMTGVVTLAVLRALNNSHQPDHGSPPTAMPGPTTRT